MITCFLTSFLSSLHRPAQPLGDISKLGRISLASVMLSRERYSSSCKQFKHSHLSAITVNTRLVHSLTRSSKLGEARMSDGLQINVLILGYKCPLIAPQKVEPRALPREFHLFDRDLSFQSRSGSGYVYYYSLTEKMDIEMACNAVRNCN